MPDQKSLQKQDGGFMMGDKSNTETLYSIMKKHFDKPSNKEFFDSILQRNSPPDSPGKTDIAFLDSEDYKDIYTKLITIIMTDEVYTQTFSDGGGGKPFFTHSGMHNYHIQLCALMTMSFLIELEVFSVVHNYIPINIDTAKNNTLPAIFKHASNPTLRYYMYTVNKPVESILEDFTRSLDNFFNDFMGKLIDEISRFTTPGSIMSKQKILEAIVPVKSTTPKHVDKTFDFIYVDWKDRIKAQIKTNINNDKKYNAGNYSIQINTAIQNALNQVERGGSKYIAEGLGFFSFLYLLPKPGVKEKYNGSCITYSMLELYIMARLHVRANNLILNIESEEFPLPHPYWQSIQQEDTSYINLPSVSHWATRYNFQSLVLNFRSIPHFKEITTKHLFNFLDPDKPKLCLLLLYPIFDSYIRYIGPMTDAANKKTVSDFITKRIAFVRNLFSKQTITVSVVEEGRRGMPPKVPVIASILPNWFNQVFVFDELPLGHSFTSFNVKKSTTNHILMTVKGAEIDVGVFRYMSVADLLKTASENTSAVASAADPTNNLKYYMMTSPAHTVHTTPGYHDSIFQVASQFNALEMLTPTQTPQKGITIYHADNTQGPVCAMVCPFGTLYRNYFCMPDAGKQLEDKSVNVNPQIGTPAGGTGSGNNQINTLTELMKIDVCFKDLRFQNGYIFVKDKPQLDAINKYLLIPENFWTAMMAIKYVIQEDTPVVNLSDGTIMGQIVSQIYCSAYPVSYSTEPDPATKAQRVPGTNKKDYELLSSMILHAVYYSTLAYAVTRITPDETRKKVFLTKVGGGAFGNDVSLIDNAIYNAVRHFTAYPIDVHIVDYKGPTTIEPPMDPIEPLKKIPLPYPDIQIALEKRAKDETEKLQKETLSKAAADKVAADKAKAEKAAADKLHDEKAEKKHLKLKESIDQAIKTFSAALKSTSDAEYVKILTELSGKIIDVRTEIDATLVSKTGKKTKGTKSEPAGNDTDAILKHASGVTSGGSRSLANVGQMCYMNAALQLIYSMDEFKKSVLSMSDNPLKNYLDAITKGGVDASSADKLANALHSFSSITPKTHRPFNSQEDSSELLLSVLQNDIFTQAKALVNFTTIESVHTTTTLDPERGACKAETGVVSHLQYATMPVPDSIKDSIIYIPNVAAQPLFIFNLPVTTTDADFNKMIQKITPMDTKAVAVTDFLTGTDCSRINKATISTQTVIIPGNTQRYFIVSLNRFNDAGDKIKTPIKLTGAEITLGTIKFGIKGCISHHGDTPKGGHYTYVEFTGGKPTTVYDDHNIVKYDEYVKALPVRTVDTEGYVLLFEQK